jgi:hypothetical protein
MNGIDEQLEQHAMGRRQAPDSQGLYRDPVASGVTVSWLAQVFDMDVKTVTRRLKRCPIKIEKTRGTKMRTRLYDLKVAAPYLVDPAFSTRDYMRALKAGDLPPALSNAVWQGLLARQRWEENAGDLWRTEAVREVLGDTFQTIKFQIQLFPDTVERHAELSDRQREIIRELCDALQQEIYDSLVRRAADRKTPSQLSELGELIGEDESLAETAMDVETDADIEAMI